MTATATARPPVTRAPPQADDRALARRLAQREEAAFDELVEQYQLRVARLAQRLLGWRENVDDVVQEVFVAALTGAKRFRGESGIWTWLARITINRCRTLQRRERVRTAFWRLLARRGSPLYDHRDAQHAVIGDETAAQVRQAVHELPQNDREVIVLRYFEELTVEQISGVLSISRGATNTRLSRARAKLAAKLKGLNEDGPT